PRAGRPGGPAGGAGGGKAGEGGERAGGRDVETVDPVRTGVADVELLRRKVGAAPAGEIEVRPRGAFLAERVFDRPGHGRRGRTGERQDQRPRRGQGEKQPRGTPAGHRRIALRGPHPPARLSRSMDRGWSV